MLTTGRFQFLFMASSPSDVEPVLDYEAEEERILDELKPEPPMNPLPFTLLVRDTLLQHSLSPATEAPANTLRQRFYRAAVALVPPSATALRSSGSHSRRAEDALRADFLRGDASALEELMAPHLQWMHDWARKHLPPHEAEDAVQEAFISLLQKAPTLQLQALLRGYLFGFLRIAVLRALRSLSRRRGESLDDEHLEPLVPADANTSPEAALLTQRSHAELAEALERSCTLPANRKSSSSPSKARMTAPSPPPLTSRRTMCASCTTGR